MDFGFLRHLLDSCSNNTTERNMMTTKYKPKYWNHKGRFQEEYQEIQTLVPAEGDAPTTIGQMLRYASKLYYDIYNNGGGNIEDSYQENKRFLLLHAESFRETAREIGVKDFATKLELFCTNNASDKENDEVIDVIISYVHQRYTNDKLEKLLNSAALAASLLVGNAPEIAADLRTLSERVKNDGKNQVPAVS